MAVDMQQERMELTRTVSHLAAATQQLASAQNVTLMHLEAIYDELKREREVKRNADHSHKKGVNYKSFNAETITNERLISNSQRNNQRNLDSDLRDHLNNAVVQHSIDSNDDEFLENVCESDERGDLTSKPSQESYHSDYYKSREFKKMSRHNRNPGKKSVSSKMAWKFKKSDYIVENSSCESIAGAVVNETEVNDEKYLEVEGSKNRIELGARKRPAKKSERGNRTDMGFFKFGNENFADLQEVDSSRSQTVNGRIKKDLVSQQLVTDNLRDDYEVRISFSNIICLFKIINLIAIVLKDCFKF